MRVAMYYSNSDVRIEEIPEPEISADEVKVRTIASGICGSDVMEWYRKKKAPIVLGHEITGEIIETGNSVNSYAVGDRVFVSHHVPCNTCYYCLNNNHTACETLHTTNFDPGGFSEFIRIPAINVDRGIFIIPEEVTFAQGSFIEPLACVVRAQRLAALKIGQSILILGSGISGLMHIKLAASSGAGRIIATDTSKYRLDAAVKAGAEHVFDATEDIPAVVKSVNDGRLADLVIICTGAKAAFDQALKSVERGGTILYFATTEPGVNLPVPINEFWRNSITLMPSYGAGPLDLNLAIEIIRSKRIEVDDMITHNLPLAEIQQGFNLVSRADKSIKVIIEPQK